MPDIYMDVDAALSEVPVNMLPLIDSGDFTTVEDAVAYDASGMDLRWNFVTTGGSFTSTAVTPTSGGNYDWTHQGDGIYTIEIPASGGASINNDTEGFGWFSGKITGVLPFRGPVIGFRASGLNDLLIDSAYSATRGLAGTALPAAAADAAGGLPISDAGGLDLDAKIGALTYGTANRVNAQVYGMQADSIAGGVISAGAVAEIQSGLATAAALVTISNTIGVAGAGLTEAGGTGDHLTAVVWNAAWDAEVQSEVDDALVAQKLDHLVAVADSDDVADNSIIAKLASKGATADWSGFVNTTDSLEALRDRGDAAWVTATSVTVSDKTGFKLASDGLDLVVPADPSAIPALGTASIVAWIGYFGAWTVNEVNSDSNSVNLRNSADDADLATHATSDDGSTFSSGEPS